MSDNNTNLYLDSLISEHDNELRKAGILSQVASAIASIATFTLNNITHRNDKPSSSHRGQVPGSKNKKRKRKDMDEYICSMDAQLFKRKYRMKKDSFFILLDIVNCEKSPSKYRRE